MIAGPEHFPDRSLLADGTTIPAPEDTYRHRCQKGSFDFHETHNHWHVDNKRSTQLAEGLRGLDGRRCGWRASPVPRSPWATKCI